jgi:hypothetical protein
MNDNFLHQIRKDPPPEFLARLKSRLDLQPPPPTVRNHSTLGRLILGLLLTGSVFAITLFFLNRSETNSVVEPVPTQQPQQHPFVTTTPPKAIPKPSAPATANGSKALKKETASNFTALTPKSLEPYLSHLADTYFKPKVGSYKVVTIDSPTESLADWCGNHARAKSDQPRPNIVLLAHRITENDSKSCVRILGRLDETAVGYQALVLARSKLYGTVDLTLTELFLALAAEVPDPARPGQLIPNPNTMWSDINSAFEREPIEILGPERSSVVGLALREILLEGGCRAIPALANVKECPELRSDGVYTESGNPYDIAQQLQTRPNALGIVPFGATQYAASVTVGPMGGVIPSMKSISNGTYPGARSLFLYLDFLSGGGPVSDYLTSALPNDVYALQRFAIIPPERSQR